MAAGLGGDDGAVVGSDGGVVMKLRDNGDDGL